MAGGLFYPDRGQSGPFTIACGDARVEGMGLPANHHVIYIITFGLRLPTVNATAQPQVSTYPTALPTSTEQPPRAKVNRYKPMAQVSTRVTKKRITK